MANDYVLGVHLSHDSSACLIKNGVVVAAVQEERLSRVKFYDGFPKQSIMKVLEMNNISPDEIHSIGVAGTKQYLEATSMFYLNQASKPRKLKSLLARGAAFQASTFKLNSLKKFYYSKKTYLDFLFGELRSAGFDLEKASVNLYDHHLCHAATAYYPSPFDTALVVTQDGRGDLLSGTVAHAEKNELKIVSSQSCDDSVAQMYAGVTLFLGFTPLRHEGKITGLAAYGKKTDLCDKMLNLLKISKDGIKKDWTEAASAINYPECCGFSFQDKRRKDAHPDEYMKYIDFGYFFQAWLKHEAAGYSREDVSFAIQHMTEVALCRYVESLLDEMSADDNTINLCLAGGIYGNVKLNQRLLDCHASIRNIYVQPAMGDCGLSLGAAILEMMAASGEPERIMPMEHVYLGNDYSEQEIEQALIAWDGEIKYYRSDCIEKDIAGWIHEGKIIGRFNGGMEYGPRALGNRSILLSPIDQSINDIVNKRLNRTEFMPFAPSVLDKVAGDYFVGYKDDHITADWMTITYDVFDAKQQEIAAVVHVDGTARPQVVKEEKNASYYKIIEEYLKLSGIGCVVNTSFNMHEEPIVASPEDALRAFMMGSVDVLAIGPFVVEHKQ